MIPKTTTSVFDADWTAVRKICVTDPECCTNYVPGCPSPQCFETTPEVMSLDFNGPLLATATSLFDPDPPVQLTIPLHFVGPSTTALLYESHGTPRTINLFLPGPTPIGTLTGQFMSASILNVLNLWPFPPFPTPVAGNYSYPGNWLLRAEASLGCSLIFASCITGVGFGVTIYQPLGGDDYLVSETIAPPCVAGGFANPNNCQPPFDFACNMSTPGNPINYDCHLFG